MGEEEGRGNDSYRMEKKEPMLGKEKHPSDDQKKRGE